MVLRDSANGLRNMGVFELWHDRPNMGALEDTSVFIVSVGMSVSNALTAVLSAAPAFTTGLSVVSSYTARLGVSNVST